MFEARVREGADAMRAESSAAAADSAALARFREMLDPAAIAQSRLNLELEDARRVMIAAGHSGEELARVEALLAARHDLGAAASGRMSHSLTQLSFQANRYGHDVRDGRATHADIRYRRPARLFRSRRWPKAG